MLTMYNVNNVISLFRFNNKRRRADVLQLLYADFKKSLKFFYCTPFSLYLTKFTASAKTAIEWSVLFTLFHSIFYNRDIQYFRFLSIFNDQSAIYFLHLTVRFRQHFFSEVGNMPSMTNMLPQKNISKIKSSSLLAIHQILIWNVSS